MADVPAPVVKPGWQTSEFWLHVAAAAAIGILTEVQSRSSALPPLAQGIVGMLAPLAIAWIAKNYGDQRTDVKQAALAAGQAAGAAQGSSAGPGSPVAA